MGCIAKAVYGTKTAGLYMDASFMAAYIIVRITASQSSIAHVLLEAIGGDLTELMGDGCSIQSDIPGRSLSEAMR
jgi:hypothetical protein